MKKIHYIRAANDLLPANKGLMDAAIWFWGAEVPLEDAKKYLEILAHKIYLMETDTANYMKVESL